MDHYASATVTGTGASIDVDLGWTPDVVEVYNLTDTTNNPMLRWMSGMVSGSAQKTTLNTRSYIGTLGITPLGNGANDTKRGFRIGADATVNVNTNTLQYVAVRNAEPKRA